MTTNQENQSCWPFKLASELKAQPRDREPAESSRCDAGPREPFTVMALVTGRSMFRVSSATNACNNQPKDNNQ